MIAATATTALRFETGDVVTGRAIIAGKTQPRRKGIVLGAFTEDDTKHVVVWWYGMGAASSDTCTLQWNDELTPAGDIWDMSAYMAKRLAASSYGYFRATWVNAMLIRHASRMASVGAKHPVK